MSSTTVTRGNSLETFYIGPTLAPSSVSAYTSASQTFTVPGLLTTDIVQGVGARGVQTTGMVTAECDCFTNNILTVQFLNVTASPATPFSGQYVFQITRAEGPLPLNAA